MGAHNFSKGKAHADPELLNAIVKASETYSIVASQDIVDVRGLKLWSKGQAVSSALQQRLLERQLEHPLEACLMAENGATLFTLQEHLAEFLESDDTLARALRPWGLALKDNLKQLPLHAVAQLMLTTALATRPDTLPHAVRAMALAGALSRTQSSKLDTRLAMLGGLLHDIGEVYIQPLYLDPEQHLDLLGHKHMVVHPRVAQLLLASTTDYPAALSRAVGEHHERLNGAGYPARLSAEDISPLGSLLAVVEVAMGVLRAPLAPLTRASFALRVVPGEFDVQWASPIFNMARNAKEELPMPEADGIEPLERINATLMKSQSAALELQRQPLSLGQRALTEMALDRLTRLRVSWNALGVWGLRSAELTPSDKFDMALADRELHLRVRELQRECMLLGERLPAEEKAVVQALWDAV